MFYRIAVWIGLLLFSPLASAHVVESETGFLSGMMHPVLGLDHLLAMLSVGVVSAQIGGRAIWTVPATFVSVMVIGGILGVMEVPIPAVEIGIALSVFALGVAIAAHRRAPILATQAFVAFFAIFHGHAHGTEMPWTASPVLYALGFVVGTSSIHIMGVLIGHILSRTETRMALLRYIGAGMAGVGAHLLIGVASG